MKTRYIFNFDGNPISSDTLKKIWRNYFGDKLFPNVRAYNLKYSEFVRVISEYEKSDPEFKKACEKAELIEYGRLHTFQEIGAKLISLNPEKTEFLILRRKNSRFTLENDLKHELEHIYNADCSKFL
jgi:hypothetical protein